jgi:glycerophosphoryl diester phosphodiesterase
MTATAGCRAKQRVESAASVSQLVMGIPFYIAHRGGGDNWPEMTAYAYQQAAKLPGLQAIEISVCRSADGVLVCSHDPTTERVTGVPYTIANETWATLSGLKVTSAFTRDPSQPSRPFSRFDEVIEQHIEQLVVFVEPKTPDAVQPLMQKMLSLNQPERVVWKQPINQPNFGTAKSHGFATWGYVLNEPGHLGDRLRQFAATPAIDMLGAQRSLPDSILIPIVQQASEHGKKTIMWNIRNAEDRSRALRLGCQGMMTSNIAEVPGIPL